MLGSAIDRVRQKRDELVAPTMSANATAYLANLKEISRLEEQRTRQQDLLTKEVAEGREGLKKYREVTKQLAITESQLAAARSKESVGKSDYA
jgi:DNA-binding protein H-NS